MKYIINIAFATCMLWGCQSASDQSAKVQPFDTTKLKKGQSFYQCEMDPDVISEKPGKCPKCNMDLVEIEKQ